MERNFVEFDKSQFDMLAEMKFVYCDKKNSGRNILKYYKVFRAFKIFPSIKGCRSIDDICFDNFPRFFYIDSRIA